MPWNVSCFIPFKSFPLLTERWKAHNFTSNSKKSSVSPDLYIFYRTKISNMWSNANSEQGPLTHPTSMQKAWKSAPFMSKHCLEDSLVSCSTPLWRIPLRRRQYSSSRHLTELMLLTYSSCVERILIYNCRLTCPMQTDLFCSKQAPIRSTILWEIINIHILITLLSPFSSS